jgi:hypothetical protein
LRPWEWSLVFLVREWIGACWVKFQGLRLWKKEGGVCSLRKDRCRGRLRVTESGVWDIVAIAWSARFYCQEIKRRVVLDCAKAVCEWGDCIDTWIQVVDSFRNVHIRTQRYYCLCHIS